MSQPRSQVRPAGHGTRDVGNGRKPGRTSVAQYRDGHHGVDLAARAPETLRIVADGKPDPGTTRLLGRLDLADVTAYRDQLAVVADARIPMPGAGAPGKHGDDLAFLAEVVAEDSPAEFEGGIVPSVTLVSGTMSFLGSAVPGGLIVPRSGVRPGLVDRFLALREGAHCHRAPFGFPARDDGRPVSVRLGESFADAVAIAALVLDSADAKEVEEIERIVMAREVACLSGAAARNSGAAARRAFQLAVARLGKQGRSAAVPMTGIMRLARRTVSEFTLRTGHDLDVMRKAVLARAGNLGELPAKALAVCIRDAADELEKAQRDGKADTPTKLKEPVKACAELRAAADAIERGMWTTADLSQGGRAKEYGETLRRDLLDTLKDHRRRGMPDSHVRFLILNEHRVGTDTATARLRTRSAASAAAKARKLPRQSRLPGGVAYAALRSECIGSAANPWRQGLPANLEALGRLSRQAANIAAEAVSHPERAELLQERFDDVMFERAGIVESIALSGATLGALLKLRGNDAAARALADTLKAQAEWDVSGEFTYLPDLSQDERKEMADQLGAVANALGEVTPSGRAPIKRMPAGVTVNERGFAVNRSAEGRIHCEDDWAIKGPNGERFAYIKDQRAMVVRLETRDGAKATTRLMTRDEAIAFADAYGGEPKDPTEEDFRVIRGEPSDGEALLRLWQG